MQAFKNLAFVIVGAVLSLTLLSCSGGGGGGGGNSSSTVIAGRVVDGYIAGATVTAYQVNANGTPGAQIGTPVITDQNGDYTLNLGAYTGPVYLTSQGGTYVDSATGITINLNVPPYSSMILSAIVSSASGNVSAQVNPLTTMAADVALTLASQGTPVASAADDANTLIQNYFAIMSPILNTALVSLNTPSCMVGYTQPSADVSAILAGISQLAFNYGVGTPDLVQALINDVSSDGIFDGLASKASIYVPLTPGPGTLPLSQIEGPALTNLASAITTFMTNTTTSNVCGATVDSSVISALSNTSSIFPTPPPAAPTGVQAAAGFGSALISWNNVAGATSYNIYTATATGVTATSTQLPGFRSIQNVTSPANISTGPTNTYYYVVTAATGTSPYQIESLPSPEVSVFVSASALPSLWAQTVTAGSTASNFEGVSVASDGSVYAAGNIQAGTFNFGNGIMSSGTNTVGNATLVKYNSSGMAQWAQTVAGSDQSSFGSVAVASDGSVYAAGYAGNSALLVKYNGSGSVQWSQTAAGSDQSSFGSVAVASDGSVYVTGNIHGTGTTGTYNFGNGVTATGPSNGYNVVLVKYNSSGTAQWAQTVTITGVANESSFNGVSVALDGSVYASGYIAGTGTTFNFGNSVTATGVYDSGNIVLVKYNSSGVAQWAQTVTAGPADSFFTSVSAVALDGSVYAAGYIQGTSTYNFGNGVTATGTATDGINIILVKYNSLGVTQWAQTVAAVGGDSSIFFGVSVGSDGSVYGTGYIGGSGASNFGNGVTATGTYAGENVVLVKYDGSGVASWAQTVTAGTSNSFFSGVSVASGGSVYAAGGIQGTGTYNFGSGATAAGTYIGGNIVLVGY